MKPSQLATLLTSMFRAYRPVLVKGKPGVAKTSVVTQAAAAAGFDLVVAHPAIEDPTDSKGLPWMEKGAKHAEWRVFGETARVLESTKPTVWFWDDFGQAPPATQASRMPWLLARRQNGNVLPDHVVICAATNERTHKAGVSGLLEPVKSRFATIVTLEADLDEWCQWALAQAWMPPELVAFLRFKPELLCQFEPSADLTNCPLPRTWENAGHVLAQKLPQAVEAEALAGAVGEGASTELLAFVQMFRELPNIDGILLDPDAANIPTKPSVLYAVTTALATKVNDKTFPRLTRYAERLVEAAHGEFATLLIRDAVRRKPEVQQTPAFVSLMAGELGQLIGGGR